MSKAIRITLIVVALLCVPALIYPELGMTNSPVSPLAVLFVCGLAALCGLRLTGGTGRTVGVRPL